MNSRIGLALTLLLPFLTTSPAGGQEPRRISSQLAVDPDSRLFVKFKAGELRVEGSDGTDVEVNLSARCRRPGKKKCERKLDLFEIASREVEDGLAIEFIGPSRRKHKKMEVVGTVSVPRNSPLDLRMWAGELQVEGTEGDLDVKMRYGDVELRMAKESVHSVALDAGIGDTSIDGVDDHLEAHRPILIGSEAVWRGGEGAAARVGPVSLRPDEDLPCRSHGDGTGYE